MYILCAQEKHHGTCPQSFQLQNDTNFITNLYSKFQVKITMLVELCTCNYVTRHSIVNGANGIFQGSTKLLNP